MHDDLPTYGLQIAYSGLVESARLVTAHLEKSTVISALLAGWLIGPREIEIRSGAGFQTSKILTPSRV